VPLKIFHQNQSNFWNQTYDESSTHQLLDTTKFFGSRIFWTQISLSHSSSCAHSAELVPIDLGSSWMAAVDSWISYWAVYRCLPGLVNIQKAIEAMAQSK